MKLKGMLAAIAVATAFAPAAFADKNSEAFVQANANTVLNVLNDKSLTPDAREKKFFEYMNKFAHMPSIARRVIGAKSRTLTEAEFNKYYKIFETYAMEVYQVHFDQFRGEGLRMTGSKDDGPQRSTVESVIVTARRVTTATW